MTPSQSKSLRALPAVGELLELDDVARWCEERPRAAVVHALRCALEQLRSLILSNGDVTTPCDTKDVMALAQKIMTREATPSLRRVINATGVVLHTGLGRAPLCAEAIQAIVDGAGGYSNLEYNLETGARGRRVAHVTDLLCRLTGADAATVVNNNAAAMVLIMRALCCDREVIVSRGQLVEIGGSFRMPDVMAAGGAILKEVGTTNRTRVADYQSAINENTAALLRVHSSNYRIVGFTEEASMGEIVDCAHRHNLIAIDDLGSGAMFDLTSLDLPPEPYVEQSLAAGADVVCFSGDKLLGGPQAGIILGRRDLIAQIESHPLMRSYRVDKLVLLALEATLRHYIDPQSGAAHIPTLSMMRASTETLAEQARTLEQLLANAMPDERFLVGSDVSYAGGGSLPGEGLPTVVIRWQPSYARAGAAAAALRLADPPVVARISDDTLCFDLRTLAERDHAPLVSAVLGTLTKHTVPRTGQPPPPSDADIAND